MHEGEEWLIRPVLEGMCKYESLLDGTLDLEDIVIMNEALDIRSENHYRMNKAMENGK